VNPTVEAVLKEAFGPDSIRHHHEDMSVPDLIFSLKECIRHPERIDSFLIWRYTSQGHDFWEDYENRGEESLEAGRRILNGAIAMVYASRPTEEFL